MATCRGRWTAGMTLLAACLFPSLAGSYCRTTTNPRQPDPLVCPQGGIPLAWPAGCAGYAIDPRGLPSDLPLATFRTVLATAAHTWSVAPCTGGVPSFRLTALGDSTAPLGYFPGRLNTNTV